ncbi:MAG: hypothetical protein FWG66_10610 [Spirochaetes bacterium]|nr:hypothetical protein [Spirochaetota bacterium]
MRSLMAGKAVFSLIFFAVLFPFQAQAQMRADALTEFRANNFEEAVRISLEEIEENANNLEAHVVASWSLIELGRYDEALRLARSARVISRYDGRVIQILGEVHYFQGRNIEALRYFQEYINLAPEGQRIHFVFFFMGEIYIRLGMFRHADIALSTAVHRVPGNALWWSRLGYARENAGDLLAAITAYERALALNAQLTDASRGLLRSRQALAGR